MTIWVPTKKNKLPPKKKSRTFLWSWKMWKIRQIMKNQAMQKEEVDSVVITDLRKIIKPVIHEDNLVIHEE